MARIPLQVASRSLDTGPLVQYPQGGGPVGAALEGAGDVLQGVALRVKQKQDQQDAFDARVREMEFSAQVSGLEQQAEQNASIDGSGIHDSVYGQIDPVSQTAVKPGSFDELFDSYLERMPESKRAEFAAKRDVYRLDGSQRLGKKQFEARQAYEKVQIGKAEIDITNAMAAGDPNDIDTFERFKQQGVDLIENSGLPPLEKDVAKTNWLANADETLFKTKLAKDPDFAANARNALGLASEGPPVDVANVGSARDGAKALIRKKEGFRTSPYWDVNAHRIGYGSDTITRADGSVVRVQPGMTVTRADAERDLDRRVQEFENIAIGQVGRREWGALPPAAKAALTSTTYNYGDLPNSVVSAVKTGNVESIASSVEALQGHNGGVNAERRRQEAAMIRGQGDMQGVGPVSEPDPAYANIPLERRLVLANEADVQVGEAQRAAAAQANADYAAYKDATELSIVSGQLVDEQLVMNDSILNDGDKASLIRSLRTQNESSIQLSSDLAALSGNSLVLDPYDTKDKTRADNLYAETMKRAGPESAVAVAGAILQQTGVVPQPVVNTMRRGLSGTNVQEFVTAAQTAQKVSTLNPAALGRRDGGAEVQKAADDFGFMVNTLNLAPEEAARRLIERNSPEKQFQRKALEPAAKEFVKTLQDEDLAAQFNDTWFGSDPSLGFTPAQEFGMKAEYLAIAEDQFYAVNGEPELAKNRAIEEMKRLYGVSSLTGRKVVMKHPPERYWPAFDPLDNGISDVAKRFTGEGVEGAPKTYHEQLLADIRTTVRGPAGPSEKMPGLVETGNIDLEARPQVKNADGSISTVRSASFNIDGKEVLIPTVSPDGKILSNEDALRLYKQTGKHLGKFDTPEHATAYAEALHDAQEKFYGASGDFDESSIQLVTTPQTDREVKAGVMPGYSVMWKDKNGVLQTIPGKLWKPDVTEMVKAKQIKQEEERAQQLERGRDADRWSLGGRDRDFTLDNYLDGNPLAPKEYQPSRSVDPGSNIPTDLPAPANSNGPR